MRVYRAMGILVTAVFVLGGCDDAAKDKSAEAKPGTDTAAKTADKPAAKGAAAPKKADITPAAATKGADLEGAKKLLGKFLAKGADHAALSQELQPKEEDYAAVFVPDAAAKAKTAYEPAWKDGALKIAPKEGQTELMVWAATTEQLKAGEADAEKFPGGYKKIADQLKPGVTFYRFKFVQPGKSIGMAFDGLVHVNGHWTIFPKPWRAVQ